MAREWHCEQLLQARLRMEQCNALQIKRGQILTTLTMSLTCDHAHEDAGLDTTVMDIPLHRDPDNPQRPYPFHPGVTISDLAVFNFPFTIRRGF